MKFRRTQIISLIATILIVGGFVLMPHEAHATGLWGMLGNLLLDSTAKYFQNAILASVAPVVVLILAIVTPIVTTFTWIMGMFLDGALIMNLHIADIVTSVGAINSMWAIVRDTLSMVIIFILLYASITMILGLNEQKIKTLLVHVVLAGLLINFSLFFTKIVIDASNIIAVYIYNQIAPPLAAGGSFSDWWNIGVSGMGLSNTLMRGLYLQNTLVPSVQGLLSGDALANMTTGMIMSTIMMTLAGFSFLAAAIILIIRLFYLILLMAFSPIWFIGLVLPQVNDYSKKWSKTLIGECMVAPIYMIFIYFAVTFMSSPALTGGGASSSALVAAAQSASATTNVLGLFNTGTVAVFFKFVIGIFLINASILAAKSFGSKSGEVGADVYAWLKKKTGSSMKSTAGFAGRNTIGAAAAKYSESEGFRKFAADKPILGGIASSGLKNISSASWGGKKGGFDAQREADEKSRKKVFKNIGTVNRADYDSDEAFHEAEKRAVELQGRYKDNLKDLRNSPISRLMGIDRSGHELEGDYNANYGKVNKDDIQKIIDENEAEIKKIKKEIEAKSKAEVDEIDTKHKADFEEIDRALKSDLSRLGSKYSDKTKEELENIKKSTEQEIENTKKSISTKWDNESKTREAPFQKKINEQNKYRSAAQRSQRKKDLKDAIEETKDDAGKPEPKKEPKPSEPKP